MKLGRTVLAAAFALSLAGCGSAIQSSSNPKQSTAPGVDYKTRTITIGASTQTTGPAAVYYMINQGASAYFDWLNASGKLHGWKIKYLLLNDGYQPTQNLANVKTLVQQDKVFAIAVNEGTATNTAAATFLGGLKTPVVAPAEGNPLLSKYSNYFVEMPNYIEECALATRYAVQTLHVTKVAALYENDDLGQPCVVGMNAELQKLGLKAAATVPFQVSDTNFTPYVSQLATAGAQAVLVWGANPDIASALHAAAPLNFHPKWFGSFFIADPSTVKLAGNLLDGFYTTSWYLPLSSKSPAELDFIKAMAKYEPSVAVGALSEHGWAEASMFGWGLEQLLNQHLPITQANLMKVLNNMHQADFGVVQKASYGAGDHVAGWTAVQGEAFTQFKNGQFVRVTGILSFPKGINYGQ